MRGANLNNQEEVDALVELWVGTPEGAILWKDIMWKWAQNDTWREGNNGWFKDMKKMYVQIMQWHLNLTISEDEPTSIPYEVLS